MCVSNPIPGLELDSKRDVMNDLNNSILKPSAFRLHKDNTIPTNMNGSMCQLQECHLIRARNFMVTLLLRTTCMRSQLLGRVSSVVASHKKYTNKGVR